MEDYLEYTAGLARNLALPVEVTTEEVDAVFEDEPRYTEAELAEGLKRETECAAHYFGVDEPERCETCGALDPSVVNGACAFCTAEAQDPHPQLQVPPVKWERPVMPERVELHIFGRRQLVTVCERSEHSILVRFDEATEDTWRPKAVFDLAIYRAEIAPITPARVICADDLVERLLALPGEIAAANVEVIHAEQRVAARKAILQSAEDQVLLDHPDLLDGKNAETRAAHMRQHTTDHRRNLRDAELSLQWAKHYHAIAMNVLSVLRTIARILEPQRDE